MTSAPRLAPRIGARRAEPANAFKAAAAFSKGALPFKPNYAETGDRLQRRAIHVGVQIGEAWASAFFRDRLTANGSRCCRNAGGDGWRSAEGAAGLAKSGLRR